MLATTLLSVLFLAIGANADTNSRMDVFFPPIRRVVNGYAPQILMGGYDAIMCAEFKDHNPPEHFNVFVQRDVNWFSRMFAHWKWKAHQYASYRIDIDDEKPTGVNAFDQSVLRSAEDMCRRYFNVGDDSQRHYVYLVLLRLPAISGTRRPKPYRLVFKYRFFSGRGIKHLWTRFAVQNRAAGLDSANMNHETPIYVKAYRSNQNGNALRPYPLETMDTSVEADDNYAGSNESCERQPCVATAGGVAIGGAVAGSAAAGGAAAAGVALGGAAVAGSSAQPAKPAKHTAPAPKPKQNTAAYPPPHTTSADAASVDGSDTNFGNVVDEDQFSRAVPEPSNLPQPGPGLATTGSPAEKPAPATTKPNKPRYRQYHSRNARMSTHEEFEVK